MAIWQPTNEGISAPPVSPHDLSADVKWFAIQTRARHEKKVEAHLHEKGIRAFLPLSNEIHQWSDRRKLVHQPLFAGYLFVNIPALPEVRNAVLSTMGVCWFVGNGGQGLPIPDKQIQDIETILNSEVTAVPHPFIRVGEKVRIRGGCLDGVEGILVAKDDDRHVVVSVELVRRSLAIRIDGYDLEKA